MGTTLTGTTPQDTYDSLIKVTDNGPISSTVKLLSDGLGNDSALALSTARVGIGTTANYSFNDDAKLAVANTSGNSTISIVSGSSSIGYLAFADGTTGTDRYTGSINYLHASDAMTFHTNAGTERMRITASGNVGIGTSTPECLLHVAGSAAGSDVTLYIDNAAGSTLNNSSRLKFSSDTGSSVSIGGAELNCLVTNAGNGAVDLLVKSWTGGAYTEKARFLAAGGLTFNGDTAAANALDDYEEGNFTPTITFGGASVGITYTENTATYTKIGRQVTVNGYIAMSNKGSSSGSAKIIGLPFTNGVGSKHLSSAALYLGQTDFANQFMSAIAANTTEITLYEVTEVGVVTNITEVDFRNNSEIIFSATYFV